ncbi:MAG: hypothetical protein NW220_12420 [Leptolyngbyaceae cyanobacterium bins.349]|nr:hypothetical protein [Leptolyngbyaceae cyanobacterium bins.349]
MSSPDVCLTLGCLTSLSSCAIASLATLLVALPSTAIAPPKPIGLAYHTFKVNTHELYVAPIWFGREPVTDEPVTDKPVTDEPVTDAEEVEGSDAMGPDAIGDIEDTLPTRPVLAPEPDPLPLTEAPIEG